MTLNSQALIDLWTFHEANFGLVSGRIDRQRSRYLSPIARPRPRDELRLKYEAVDRQVGHNQYLWCYPEYPERAIRIERRDGRLLHHLRVPRACILTWVDEYLAHEFVEHNGAPRRAEWARIRREIKAHHGADPDRRMAELVEQAPRASGVEWPRLFEVGEADFGVSAIIPFPIDAAWKRSVE